MTFSTLQTLTTNSINDPASVVVPVANDDSSVADRLAKYYENQGVDPARAYDTPDDAIADFGFDRLI